MPTKVYKKPRGGKREEAFDHPLYELLDSEPNEWQDPLQFKETLAVHCAVTNNAYAFKNVRAGQARRADPDRPDPCAAEMDQRPHAILRRHRAGRLAGNLHAGRASAYPRSVLGRSAGPRRGAAAAGTARTGARDRADACDAARAWRAAERHHLGQQGPRREGADPPRGLGEEALQRPRQRQPRHDPGQ